MQNLLKKRAAFILALTIPLNLLASCHNSKEETSSIDANIAEEKSDFIIADMVSFLARMSEIIPRYNVEAIYLSDEEIEELINSANDLKTCNNTSLDIEDIYNSIINNSTDEFGNLKQIYEDIDEQELQEMSKMAKDCLQQALHNLGSKISLEDACVLKDLTIGFKNYDGDSFINYYGKDRVLLIDYKAFKNSIPAYTNNPSLFEEGLTRYIELGLNYARLTVCECRIKKGQNYECIGEKATLDYLMNSALCSGDNSKLLPLNEIIFDNMGTDFNHSTSVLLLAAVFKDNRNIDDLYQSAFDADLKKLFDFFGLKNETEITEFYRIARTIEALSVRSDYEDIYFENDPLASTLSYRNHIGYAYKVSLFKISIRDLINHIAVNKDLNIKEAMFLYKFAKSIVTSSTEIAPNSYDEDYVNDIIGIENIYFDFLSKFYNLDLETIDSIYEDYTYFTDINNEKSSNSNIDYPKLRTIFPLLTFIQEYYYQSSYTIERFDNYAR